MKREAVDVRCHLCKRVFVATLRMSGREVLVPGHRKFPGLGIRLKCDGGGIQTLSDYPPYAPGPSLVPRDGI